MEKFGMETKNNRKVNEKPRVYFCCHPNDLEKYFKKVSSDIFKSHDCAIWYTFDMSEPITEDEKESTLGRCNLFVVPVTYELLTEKNRAMDEDIPYALENNIPVLPFMMGRDLDSIYSSPDKFGEMQYLNPNSKDTTEMSYEGKLKKFLDSVLISAEMAKRVRAAFDAYIFLSYRKKDRKYANELMKLVHNIPECRDIAIWFDEFLIPGESFRDGIEKLLMKSKLFTLLVTPNLLEIYPDGTKNFVMKEEYPRAKEVGIEILPVEMEKTDHAELEKNYKEIPLIIDPKDDEMLRDRLLKTIMKLATEENNSPEHNFLIGLAYLEGIDVEVNHERGMELITSAAENGLTEAKERLVDIYKNGLGVKRDMKKACEFKKMLNEQLEKELKKDFEEITAGEDKIRSYDSSTKDISSAMEIMEVKYAHQKSLDVFKAIVGERVNEYCDAQLELCDMWVEFGDSEKAANVLGDSIELLTLEPSYDTINIYENGIISKPNSDMTSRGFFNLNMKLIKLLTGERKYSLLREWYQRIKNWLAELETRYTGSNEDFLQFRRTFEIEVARSLYVDGKYEELIDVLQKIIDDTVGYIKKRTEFDMSKMQISIGENGEILLGGIDPFSMMLKEDVYFDFLSDAFSLLGDARAELGSMDAAIEAYDEALAANKSSKNKKEFERELSLKLKMSEQYYKNGDIDNARSILAEFGKHFRYSEKASISMLELKRAHKRIVGDIALEYDEKNAELEFSEAIELSEILLDETQTVENYRYLAELYEKLYHTTDDVNVKNSCIEKMLVLTTKNPLSRNTPRSLEALGDVLLLIYKCNRDEKLLKRSLGIFTALVERYPESSVFLAKMYVLRAYMDE